MPLSRHFYSLDEVQAALQYSTATYKIPESIFWCKELILSGAVTEAISILFESWLLHTGPYRLQWLIDVWNTLATDDVSEEHILQATYRLASILPKHRDNSLWYILILTLQNPNKMPDRVTPKTPPIGGLKDPKELYFVRAIFQRKTQSAWWISQYLPIDRVWNILATYAEYTSYFEEYKICLKALEEYDKLLGYRSAEYDIITRCMAILMLCINDTTRMVSFKPQEKDMSVEAIDVLDKINKNIGFKAGRIFRIPTACLYGHTARGKMKWSQNNLKELNNVEKYLAGCSFWDDLLCNLQLTNLLESDDDIIEKYFPDDIPDEWTKDEKNKSHGDGILGPDEFPTICKFSKNYMKHRQNLAWGINKRANMFLETVALDEISVASLLSLYKVPDVLDLRCLAPVRRRRLVV